jgi:hypothetical protein
MNNTSTIPKQEQSYTAPGVAVPQQPSKLMAGQDLPFTTACCCLSQHSSWLWLAAQGYQTCSVPTVWSTAQPRPPAQLNIRLQAGNHSGQEGYGNRQQRCCTHNSLALLTTLWVPVAIARMKCMLLLLLKPRCCCCCCCCKLIGPVHRAAWPVLLSCPHSCAVHASSSLYSVLALSPTR